jgi:hypothetical protein
VFCFSLSPTDFFFLFFPFDLTVNRKKTQGPGLINPLGVEFQFDWAERGTKFPAPATSFKNPNKTPEGILLGFTLSSSQPGIRGFSFF